MAKLFKTVGLGYQDESTTFPSAYHDRDGDCIEIMFSADSFYVDVGKNIDLYRSQHNGDIVGALIKNVSTMRLSNG